MKKLLYLIPVIGLQTFALNYDGGGGVGGSSSVSLTTGAVISGISDNAVLYAGTGGILTGSPSELYYDPSFGRFGINTSAPSATLGVNGGIAFAGGFTGTRVGTAMVASMYGESASASNMIFRHFDNSQNGYYAISRGRGTNASKAALQSGDIIGSYVFQGYTTSSVEAVGAQIRSTVSGTVSSGVLPAYLSLFTSNSSGVTTEAVRISTGGLVGIGTTSPSTTLDVNGTITAAALAVTGSGSSVISSTQSTLNLTTDYNGTPSTTTFTDNGGVNAVTGIAVDAEGTGNTLTTVEKVFFPAAGCNNATASTMMDLPTSNAPAPGCRTGSNVQKGVLDFDAATDEAAYTSIPLPADWTGAVDARFFWEANDTGTNSAIWTIATACLADGETDDPSFNTASSVTDANGGTTAHKVMIAAVTGITTTGCAAGEFLHLKVTRDADNGSDNLAVDARLIGVELTLRRAQ